MLRSLFLVYTVSALRILNAPIRTLLFQLLLLIIIIIIKHIRLKIAIKHNVSMSPCQSSCRQSI